MTLGVTPAADRSRAPLRALAYVLRVFAVNFLTFALLAELASIILVHWHRWPASRPSYHLNYNLFWADINPSFGVWHRANSVFVHKGGCYDVTYYTNSYGARDIERSLHSTRPRTVVLGDSIIEGMGLPADERLSNILEKETGREHLNFGTGGNFGPLQYALLYKTLAAQFDHNLVIVGVLPDNDFHDMDVDINRKNGAGDRYRPYYADDFSIFYTGRLDPKGREGTWDHVEAFLRAYLASYHVGQYVYFRLLSSRPHAYSGYNDYSDVDLARLKHALLDIKSTADAHGAHVAVILIPRLIDFLRFEQGQDRLGPAVEDWGSEAGIPVRDLLPQEYADSHGEFRRYFNPCDGHWSYDGNEEAAKIVRPWLYGQAAAP